MIDTQNLLYVVLSVAALWITAFLCWLLYEGATFLHRTNKIAKSIQDTLAQAEMAVGAIRSKILNPLSALGLLSGGGKALFSMFKKAKGKKSKKKKSELFDEE